VIPKKDVFKNNDYKPSASVVLTLNNRLDVPKDEAQAVKHIVSASVPGLSPSRITIVDSNGKILARARSDEEGDTESATDAADMKFTMEERYRNMINNMIEQVVGQGKVDAQVTVDMDFQRSSEVSEKYDPDGQVPRSTQTTESISTSSGGAGGGEVSVANELTGAGANGGGGSSDNSQKTDEVTNFEISKTVTNKVNDVGTVKKVSVAVLVDGSYTKDDQGNEVYAPRTDEQLDQIKTLVRSAIGYDEARGDKVDVVNMQFNKTSTDVLPNEGPLDFLKRDLDSIIKTVVLGIVAILVILLVIRPLVNKAFDVSAADMEAQELKMMANNEAMTQASAAVGGIGGAAPPAGEAEGNHINLDVIQSKIDYSPTQKVNDLIDNNPEETLSIIRSWLVENKG
jgi:flagellar M-ring protein FliF